MTRWNHPVLNDALFFDENFWWLIGYIQGDGHVNRKDGCIVCASVDKQLINETRSTMESLFKVRTLLEVNSRKDREKKTFRAVVYCRELIEWLERQGFLFGISKWNVPVLPDKLFYAYVAGLFDAEGSIGLRKNKTLKMSLKSITIVSKNIASLELVACRLQQSGIEAKLISHKRKYVVIRIMNRPNLEQFVESIGRFCRLLRKRQFLSKNYLPLSQKEQVDFLVRYRTKVTPDVKKKIFDLKQQGISASKIGNILGLGKTTVLYRLKEAK